MAAYQDAISATSSKRAPWFVIPANHNWFRNLVVSQIIVDAMEELDMSDPRPTVDLPDIRRRCHAEIDNRKGNEKRNSRQANIRSRKPEAWLLLALRVISPQCTKSTATW
jgi:hypothetical protein